MSSTRIYTDQRTTIVHKYWQVVLSTNYYTSYNHPYIVYDIYMIYNTDKMCLYACVTPKPLTVSGEWRDATRKTSDADAKTRHDAKAKPSPLLTTTASTINYCLSLSLSCALSVLFIAAMRDINKITRPFVFVYYCQRARVSPARDFWKWGPRRTTTTGATGAFGLFYLHRNCVNKHAEKKVILQDPTKWVLWQTLQMISRTRYSLIYCIFSAWVKMRQPRIRRKSAALAILVVRKRSSTLLAFTTWDVPFANFPRRRAYTKLSPVGWQIGGGQVRTRYGATQTHQHTHDEMILGNNCALKWFTGSWMRLFATGICTIVYYNIHTIYIHTSVNNDEVRHAY